MPAPPDANWYLYLVRTARGALYCGITVDVEKRVATHNNGRGSKYLRGALPVTLVISAGPLSHRTALQQELRIKKLLPEEKLPAVQVLQASAPRFQAGPPAL